MHQHSSRYREVLAGIIDGLSLLLLPSFTSAPRQAALLYDRRGQDVPILHDEIAVAYLSAEQLRDLGRMALLAADLIEDVTFPQEEAA